MRTCTSRLECEMDSICFGNQVTDHSWIVSKSMTKDKNIHLHVKHFIDFL